MAALLQRIQGLVASGRYVVDAHAAERLEERGLVEWQIVDGIGRAKLLLERPGDRPNPAIEVEQVLADGAPVKVVWSHLISADIAKLVTVHFFDEAS